MSMLAQVSARLRTMRVYYSWSKWCRSKAQRWIVCEMPVTPVLLVTAMRSVYLPFLSALLGLQRGLDACRS